jgi:ring-1,2-phenylacetyl-CoA epoxidase subunit PaaE
MELKLRITKIISETKDTKSFFLQPVDGSALNYKAGQFLTLLIEHNKREVRRSYSLGSTPLFDKQLFITVKRKVNGEISRHLFDHCHEGDIVTSLIPSGRFIIYEPIAQTYFFIAAGSGITPVFALMKELLYHHNLAKIILINQCRDEENIIYKKQLLALQQKFEERLEIIQFLSRPRSKDHDALHLNNEILEKIINLKIVNCQLSIVNCQFYLCGPLPFMRMAEFTVRLLGFSVEQIRKEHFVIDTPPHAPLLIDTSFKRVTIHYQQKTYHIQVAYPTSILDAALENNIQLPYSCKGGRCSTCSAYRVNGKIVMSMNEVLTEKDIAKGLVLTCVGFAATDVELSFQS